MTAPFNPSFAAPAGAAVGADLDNAPQAHLEHTAEGDPEAEVLVIGSGPAGAGRRAGAGLAGRYRVITRYRWTANTPRAQRTMEIFRALGIEDDVLAHGIEHALMGDSVFCTSLASMRDRPSTHLWHPPGARSWFRYHHLFGDVPAGWVSGSTTTSAAIPM
jgi:hypothetical protein